MVPGRRARILVAGKTAAGPSQRVRLCGVGVLRGEDLRGRLAGPEDGGWAVYPVPAGIAAPRTNVLLECLPVKCFPNEFSDYTMYRVGR